MAEEWLDEVAELLRVVSERSDVDFLEVVKGDLQFRFSRSESSTELFRAPISVERNSTPVTRESPRPEPVSASVRPADATLAGGMQVAATDQNRVLSSPNERAGTRLVLAPMVGIFYRAPDPGTPPFVEIGSTVTPDSTLGLVEAMKVYAAVHAEVGGVIEEILAEDGDFVQYEQPVFRVCID
jgi:acetyl-CoA carboxylase biotin carboxyl carrier protein